MAKIRIRIWILTRIRKFSKVWSGINSSGSTYNNCYKLKSVPSIIVLVHWCKLAKTLLSRFLPSILSSLTKSNSSYLFLFDGVNELLPCWVGSCRPSCQAWPPWRGRGGAPTSCPWWWSSPPTHHRSSAHQYELNFSLRQQRSPTHHRSSARQYVLNFSLRQHGYRYATIPALG